MEMDDGGDGDDGDVGDDGGDSGDDNNPLFFLDGLDTDSDEICDINTGICDFSSLKDEAKIDCDEIGGKIIFNDFIIVIHILLAHEEVIKNNFSTILITVDLGLIFET